MNSTITFRLNADIPEDHAETFFEELKSSLEGQTDLEYQLSVLKDLVEAYFPNHQLYLSDFEQEDFQKGDQPEANITIVGPIKESP